jgi:dihydrofolate reductase
MLIGRKTYQMLSGLPKAVRDAGWDRTTKTPGWLFSRTLKSVDWPGLKLIHDDLEGVVRKAKLDGGPEVRVLGSLSLVRQLWIAGLLDRLKLVICPLVLPQTGIEPLFEALPDTGFDLVSSQILDGRVLLLDYRPVGPPPTAKVA